MASYILGRVLSLIPILLFVSVVVFLMIHLIPGDAAVAIAGPDATPQALAALRVKLGLDQPLYVQYWIWLSQVLHGDFGVSNVSHLPTARLIMARLPATIELTVAAIVFAVVFALPVGIVAGLNWGKAIDRVVAVVTSVGLSVPEYWSGLLAILFFSVYLGWLPPGGRVAPEDGMLPWLQSLLLPAITLGFPIACIQVRFVRSSIIEVMREQYVLTARAKGLSQLRIVVVHALRNSLIPLMTVVSIQIGRLMGGAILVESIYDWPGIGRLVVQSIAQRDYSLVQGTVLLIAIIFAILSLVADFLYGVVDPRIALADRRDR